MAICHNCHGVGYISSKCPWRMSSPTSSRPPNANAFSSYALNELQGPKLMCTVVPANAANNGDIDGFPDSGSKISSQLVRHMTPLSCSKPLLLLVVQSPPADLFVFGYLLAKLSVVEAAVLASHSWRGLVLHISGRIAVKPPHSPQLHHLSRNIVIHCHV